MPERESGPAEPTESPGGLRLPRSERVSLAAISGLVLLLLAGSAFGLASSQERSRDALLESFRERAEISGGLVEGTATATIPDAADEAEASLSGAEVSAAQLREAAIGGDDAGTAILLDAGGRVIAAFPQGIADVGEPLERVDQSVRTALTGEPGISNVLKDVQGIDGNALRFAVPFDTQHGRRILVSTFPVEFASLFFGAALTRIPQIEGGTIAVIDENGRSISGAGVTTPEELAEVVEAVGREMSGTSTIGGVKQHFESVGIDGTPYRMVVTAPERELFSSVRGATFWVPWAIFAAFAVASILGLLALRRTLRGAVRIREANRRLEQRNRDVERATRAKSDFLANMSHELRTPLNTIIGFSELIRDDPDDPPSETHKEYLGDVLASSRHLLELINDVLDLSKVEAGRIELNPEPFDPAEAAREAAGTMAPVAGRKKIDLAVQTGAAPAEVRLDRQRFHQILLNYLSNALKFTPDGGRVVVRVAREGEGELRVSVEDTGIGIREEDLPRLFGEFEQLDVTMAKEHAGTGLGLALTKQIVNRQGGQVGAYSTFREGSTFFAILPVAMDSGEVTDAGDE